MLEESDVPELLRGVYVVRRQYSSWFPLQRSVSLFRFMFALWLEFSSAPGMVVKGALHFWIYRELLDMESINNLKSTTSSSSILLPICANKIQPKFC